MIGMLFLLNMEIIADLFRAVTESAGEAGGDSRGYVSGVAQKDHRTEGSTAEYDCENSVPLHSALTKQERRRESLVSSRALPQSSYIVT